MDSIDLTSPVPVTRVRGNRKKGGQKLLQHVREDLSVQLPLKDTHAITNPLPDDPQTHSCLPKKSLTRAQRAIVDAAKSGISFFFTGCAGTGKTFTLRSVIDELPQGSTYITATTGISASLLPRGTTLHSFAGIGHCEGTREQILKKVQDSSRALKNWKNAKTLVVDEVSMLSKDLFETLDFIARDVRHCDTIPFGGLQLIFCGDFFQLPPVSRKETFYCFESPLWNELFGSHSFELTEIFRQKDPRLIDLLNDIRYGHIEARTLSLIDSLKREIRLPSGIIPTMLVPMNATADAINISELQKLPAEMSPVYQCKDWGVDSVALELLSKLTLFPDKLPLRVGAQVMLLKNQSQQRLWNGSRGVVVGFREMRTLERTSIDLIESCPKDSLRFEYLPVVRFSSGQEIVVGADVYELESFAPPNRRSVPSDKSKVRAWRIQIPLRLSWAITIHKSQGMTLEYLKVDCCRSFEAGQAYVALSRAQTVEGLQVLSFDPRKCWCDTKVVDFYKVGIRRLGEVECDELALKSGKRVKPKKQSLKELMTDWISKDELRGPQMTPPEQPINTLPLTQISYDELENSPEAMANLLSPRIPNYFAPYAFSSKEADVPPLPKRTKHREL